MAAMILAFTILGTALSTFDDNTFKYYEFVIFELAAIIVTNGIMSGIKMRKEFNFAVGMGKTRKEFLFNYIVISEIYICCIILVLIIFNYIRDAFVLYNEINERVFDIIVNPIFVIGFILFNILVQLIFFVVSMIIPEFVFTLWLIIYLFTSNVIYTDTVSNFFKGLFINIFEKPLDNILLLVCIGATNLILIMLLSKKILKLKVAV